MRLTLRDVEKTIEQIRIASGLWSNDLGRCGAYRIERDIKNILIANSVKPRKAKTK